MNNPTPNPLVERVLNALVADGRDLQQLKPEQLVALDQFHLRGKIATEELATLLSAKPGERLLDLGAGVGGAARYLQQHQNCQVVGLELDPDYVELARELARLTGFEDRIEFTQGSALDIPFESSSFDHVWLQHLNMYLADKAAFFGGIARVLKPGGSLVMQEVVQGLGGDVLLPVPWARTESDNHLVDQQTFVQLLAQAGFEVVELEDRSAAVCQWLEQQLELQKQSREAGKAPKQANLSQLLGSQFGAMMANQRRNFLEQRTALLQIRALRRA
ncbi:class I SAM-dependent methyltransferase [Motiliproteus coralliicola]|uniref:Class I SAM-dependent methyltransferase n=1 Tax=Motiliproteus coralliicola TaxID=2283196 RepID=A0A369WU72_9GAMM|nr:class I SAM-dependent methyltransferase [Motiliproteus coralliicola]RDE24609.1 class I SAM-dependent methyltransferase [Motiliproteus coralliicola]